MGWCENPLIMKDFKCVKRNNERNICEKTEVDYAKDRAKAAKNSGALFWVLRVLIGLIVPPIVITIVCCCCCKKKNAPKKTEPSPNTEETTITVTKTEIERPNPAMPPQAPPPVGMMAVQGQGVAAPGQPMMMQQPDQQIMQQPLYQQQPMY